MNRGVYTIASGGLAAEARLDAVAQNLANANTTGYKAQRVAFDARPIENFARPLTDRLAAETVPQAVGIDQRRDFAPGPVTATGSPFDVAIMGRGFFAVATPAGERYTREGSFHVDAEGFLVTARGERVQGADGDVSVGRGGEVAIADDGTVEVDGDPAGRLQLLDFGAEPALVGEGDALFAAVPGTVGTPMEPGEVSLQQGALERANVDVVASLVELIDVSRGYESYMKAIQRLDEVAKRSIDEIGRVG